MNSGDIQYDFIKSYDSDFFKNNPHLDFALMKKPITGTYPDKVVFSMEVPKTVDEWISTKTGKIKYNISKVAKQLESYSLAVEPLTVSLLDEWYIGYKMFLSSIPFGIDRTDLCAMKTNINNYLLVSSRDTINNMQCGVLLRKSDHKLSYSYAWYMDEFKNIGGGTACVIKSIEYAINNGCTTFTLGMDTNLYGGHLSLGLAAYKGSLMNATKMHDASMYKIFVNPNTTKRFCYFVTENDNLKKVCINYKL
jgi:hypothetical protein